MPKKIILDLCGGTGAWSAPYKEAGYDVRVITLPDHDVRIYKPPKNVHGILAAPPCQMFSIARTVAKVPRNLRKGMETVIACLDIIWECRYTNKLAFWAMENPVGYLRQLLGKPLFTFTPWEFGEVYSKQTDIWGYFNTPKKKYNTPPLSLRPFDQWGKHLSHKKQTELRSITPSTFAQAFYKANK